MSIKNKLAALLRRWAYAMYPETPAALPPGYKVRKIVAYDYLRYLPIEEEDEDVKRQLRRELAKEITAKNDSPVDIRVERAAIPGELLEYTAVLYVGIKEK